jgi:predicted nucleic acid-binding protein
MKGWLLDTNVVSELRKRHCDPNVRSWSERHPPASFFLSHITIAEIRFGIERVAEGSGFRADLEAWLQNTLRPWFANRILEVDEQVILTWRRMVEMGRRRNYNFSQPDLFIAATALVHDLCVVTRNSGDFEVAAVPVMNPWTDNAPRTTQNF